MLRAVFVLLLLVSPLIAEDNALVKVADFWRVQPFLAGASEPRPDWNQPNYDDSSWPLRQASFTSLIFGAPGVPEQTYLDVDGISTYCFRKTFTLSDPTFIKWLALRIDYEHGFVAYLNGSEIARRSFTSNSTSVPLGATANYHPRGPTELIDVSAAAPSLRPGPNVLAIQVHSMGEDDPGILLVTELLANFTRGPFIQNTTTNSTQVIWQTSQPATGFVVYGKDQDHLSIASAAGTSPLHAVSLTGLEPGQNYIYRVYAERDGAVVTSDWTTFRSLKMPGAPITFLVVGDTGQATTGQYAIADQMKTAQADLLVHVGDIIYPGFSALHADARCFSIYRDQMRRMPFFFSLGNHDEYGEADYLQSFYLPTNTMTGTEIYYSFDHGDAHFVILASDNSWVARHDYDPGSPQYRWLEADLAASRQRWKFLFFHHTIHTSSLHYIDDYLQNGTRDKDELQAFIGGLAERYGAQIIFNGHDHNYERFASFNGVNSLVSGGGGASLYPQSYNEVGTVQYYMSHEYLRVSVAGPDLVVDAINENGQLLERFYRSQVGAAAQTHNAGWATLNIEATAGSGTDGNTLGQVFPFAGRSIPTRAGLRANLGRLHVRNDRNYLYVGFEQASIWPNQVVALFLENPARPGITDLAILGDNQLDAPETAQGADGLDQLNKLLFKDFQPSIACLLGDEMGDANLRTFRRPQMRWATGQGVFRLDQNFSSVPGVRLQQFNRSPQTAPTRFKESNADLMEVAIPLSELGAPKSPGTIRLGAIVFTDPATGAMEPEIDTAFAGVSLNGAADGRVLLEPMTIQLAPDPNPFVDAFQFRAQILSATQIRFTWNSIPGVTYRIQATPQLGQDFADIDAPGMPLIADGAVASFDLTVADPQQFYRLRAN